MRMTLTFYFKSLVVEAKFLLDRSLVHPGPRLLSLGGRGVHPLWIEVAGPQEGEIDFVVLDKVPYVHFAQGLQIM